MVLANTSRVLCALCLAHMVDSNVSILRALAALCGSAAVLVLAWACMAVCCTGV
jgi:hypothetical protein